MATKEPLHKQYQRRLTAVGWLVAEYRGTKYIKMVTGPTCAMQIDRHDGTKAVFIGRGGAFRLSQDGRVVSAIPVQADRFIATREAAMAIAKSKVSA